MGIGDWRLGNGDWGFGIFAQTQTPNLKPQTPNAKIKSEFDINI